MFSVGPLWSVLAFRHVYVRFMIGRAFGQSDVMACFHFFFVVAGYVDMG